jgi:hypothetical protein
MSSGVPISDRERALRYETSPLYQTETISSIKKTLPNLEMFQAAAKIVSPNFFESIANIHSLFFIERDTKIL